jgi:hypothetical protein
MGLGRAELTARVVSVIAAVGVVFGPGCGRPNDPSAAAGRGHVKNLEADESASLERVCTTSGPELCFNAVDDNCNGVFDEGCGVRAGAVQFVVAWDEGAVDLDLSVKGPDGVTVSKSRRSAPSGLTYQRDCPSETCLGQNFENVFGEADALPRGKFEVEIRWTGGPPSVTSTPVRLGVKVGAHTVGRKLTIRPGETKRALSFDYEP